ncbi:N-6 DNA methylase [Gelidibacter salicanalis]|uniref:site-specific DNA-methyltransferase (adenine-specific) n=1 Tax=Gelidibacter salicanalis TaxID=291193 RepID=A0A934KWH0_9FLAO|nr:N-6 DNA methylase [Gelidibacter salicanalis]MBJ7881877.1 N-6 DNA methylase [Gelidibacter salicanalis]
MSEGNYMENRDVIRLTEQYWQSIINLRQVLPVDEYHLYLFLLSAFYDGIIGKEFTKREVDYEGLFYALEDDFRYFEIIHIYKPIINNIPEWPIQDMIEEFDKIGNNIPVSVFNKVFENLLFRLISIQGKHSGEFLLPNEISSLVMELIVIPARAKVFNPFAGLASFATYLNNAESYFGQEINNSTWALGKLRLLRLEKSRTFNIDYRVEDSINNWPEFKDFDLIVSNPPFNYKIDSFIADQFGRKRMTAETYVINKGLKSINFDGKVACVISQGLLFKGGEEQRFREYLVEEGLIETIVSLPDGILKHTGIPVCIMILTRKRISNRVIKLIDASSFLNNENKREKHLDVDRLLDHLNEFSRSKTVMEVSIDQVRQNHYNLNIKRYFLEDFNGVSLYELVQPIRGQRVGNENKTKGKFVRTSNLKDNDVSYLLNLDEIKERELPFHSNRIDSNCILISMRWKSLKPTLFEYKGVPIFIGIDVVAIKVHSNNFKVDPHYLISELRSTKVLKQVAAFQNPGAVTSLNRDDFFEIKIDVPTIEEQTAKVKGILELSEKFKVLQKERNALAHGQEVKSFDEFASLKHSLGTPRQNILSNAKSLIRFFESNDTSGFDEVKKQYAERYKTSLINDLIQIKEDINHISAILEKGEKGLVLENHELTPISVKDIQKVLRGLKSSRDKFTLHFEQASNDEIKGKAILANLTLFQILIDNIISNAEKYGFKNISKLNLLIIELKVTEELMIIEMKNNGLPFPENFSKEKFIAKFSTSSVDNGSGLGGYDINRIASYFDNPDWELTLNEEDIFPVIFRFSFPIIPMINE